MFADCMEIMKICMYVKYKNFLTEFEFFFSPKAQILIAKEIPLVAKNYFHFYFLFKNYSFTCN